MNVLQTLSMAASWGMHGGGWWILGLPLMVLCMGAMMWMMRGMGGRSSAPTETPATPPSALEILDRRFAEGAISPEDYRTRREVLLNGSDEPNETAEPSGDEQQAPLAVSGAGEGRTP